MGSSQVSETDRKRAQVCVECVGCKRARERQRGSWFWFVKFIEGGLCPYCKAYEKVYGRKAHEAVPEEQYTVDRKGGRRSPARRCSVRR